MFSLEKGQGGMTAFHGYHDTTEVISAIMIFGQVSVSQSAPTTFVYVSQLTPIRSIRQPISNSQVIFKQRVTSDSVVARGCFSSRY